MMTTTTDMISKPSNHGPTSVWFTQNSKLKISYNVIFERDEDGRMVVSSSEPDLQGLATDGADMTEARKNAIEAINLILDTRGKEKDYSLNVIEK